MNKMEVKFDDCGRYPSWSEFGNDFWRCEIVSVIIWAW